MAYTRNTRQEITDALIDALERGTAPWQRPWKQGYQAPMNPITEKAYRGINNLHLDIIGFNRGYEDPRWLTYKQAGELGGQVRKGERSTSIEYWKWTERAPMMDENNQPLINQETGKQRYQDVALQRPQVFYANLFNADQIDGLPKLDLAEPTFTPDETAERMIASMDIPIKHVGDKPCYMPFNHEIRMPPKENFSDQAGYYGTLLHELGHATGHKTLLARDLTGGFGSENYAREELRAEIASFMLAREHGIAHDTERHASYVGSWIKALKEDRNEIFRASRDAEIMKSFIAEPERRPALIETAQAARVARENAKTQENKTEKTAMETEQKVKRFYINVPFKDKEKAKALGARWDKLRKSWYAPNNVEKAPFEKWQKVTPEAKVASNLTVQEKFALSMKEQGLIVKGEPVMDGKWHRVAVEGDQKGKASGSYRGFSDAQIPNGQIMNYKTMDKAMQWTADAADIKQGYDPEKLKAQAEKISKARAKELYKAQAEARRNAYGLWENAPAANNTHPYLQSKQVQSHGLKQTTRNGDLIIPLKNAYGALQNVQLINQDGSKRFLKGGEKLGNFHMIGEIKEKQPILIAEGYATAASLHEATKLPVAVAFDAGNLKPVGQDLRRHYIKSEIVFAADQDVRKDRNIGVERANEAVQVIPRSRVIVPNFTKDDLDQKRTDFNDFAVQYGHAKLAAAVNAELQKPLPEQAKTTAEAKTEATKAKPAKKQAEEALAM